MGDPSATQTWLITGGTGQLGRAIQLAPFPGIRLYAPSRSDLDLANLGDVRPILEREGITSIINCGAYTAVDRAESEPALAHAVNAIAPAQLAAGAESAGIPIVHISTDYVFPSDKPGPWQEQDPLAPVSVYGRTKADGEAAIRASGARHAIVRTAWVVSADGQNFIKTMLRLAGERETLRVVDDQRGTPTHASDLAGAVNQITAALTSESGRQSGTWHCTNAGATTWYGLALHVFECASRLGLKTPLEVLPITSAEYPTPAVRPSDSRLDTSAIARDFSIHLRPWQDAVAEVVEQLAQERLSS